MILLAWILATAEADAERLRQTAPAELTLDAAREHFAAARAAGAAFRVDPTLLLSIAHHESRYRVNATQREHHGGTSCGVMQVTPWPLRACTAAELTLAGGYRAGAARLRAFLDVCRGQLRCALTGYAGGFKLIQICRTRGAAACSIPDRFITRAARIRGK